MKTSRFDKFPSRVAILAGGGCIVSVFRIALHYCFQIVHSPEQDIGTRYFRFSIFIFIVPRIGYLHGAPFKLSSAVSLSP